MQPPPFPVLISIPIPGPVEMILGDRTKTKMVSWDHIPVLITVGRYSAITLIRESEALSCSAPYHAVNPYGVRNWRTRESLCLIAPSSR